MILETLLEKNLDPSPLPHLKKKSKILLYTLYLYYDIQNAMENLR